MPCFLVAGRASRGASAAAMDASGAAAAEPQDADGATASGIGSEPASAFVLSQDTDNAAESAAASALIAAGFTAEKSSSAGTGAASLAAFIFTYWLVCIGFAISTCRPETERLKQTSRSIFAKSMPMVMAVEVKAKYARI